jgi:hypothetical protein
VSGMGDGGGGRESRDYKALGETMTLVERDHIIRRTRPMRISSQQRVRRVSESET